MLPTETSQPKVVLIVGPRERFSATQASLESIYNDTDYPFDLIYVDVCTPAPIHQYLEAAAKEKQFTLLHTDFYVSPTQAKNVGLKYVLDQAKDEYKYVVFVENDVIVKRGWLDKLVACAEETNAAVVGPLTCIGQPVHQVIHNAGGKSQIVTEVSGDQTRRYIRQSAALTGKAVVEVGDRLHRKKTDYVEYHCMLVRTEIFDKIGLLDEGMMATREHIDFCFMVAQTGGTIYSEREAVITTDTIGVESNKEGLVKWFGEMQLPDFKWYDLPYFMVRWNDEWDLASLHHLRKKWDLTEDEYFTKRYAKVGARRHELLIKPWVDRLTFGNGNLVLENLLIAIERPINRLFYQAHLRHKKRLQKQTQTAVGVVINEPLPLSAEASPDAIVRPAS